MSIKKRIGTVIIASIAVLVAALLLQTSQQRKTVTKELGTTVSLISEKAEEEIETSLKDTAKNISDYAISLENQTDEAMLNAAFYLQEAYQNNPALTDGDLKTIAKKLNMTDLLISNKKGDFILATDSASKSVNLFDIWEGYRGLLSDGDLILPSDLKISAESGSIFKYTAIPRKDGKGCIEAALNSDSIKNALSGFVEGTKGFTSLIMVDYSNTVLISFGEEAETSSYVEGDISTDSNFTEVFSSNTEKILVDDKDKISIYYPVQKSDAVTYVLRLTLDKTPYFTEMNVLSNNAEALTNSLTKSLNMGIIVNLFVLFAMAFCILFSMNHIMKPVITIASLADRISKGDLNVHIAGKYPGELNVLVNTFNSMTEDLHGMLQNVTQTSDTIKDSSNTLRSSLNVITESGTALSTAMEEISTGTANLAIDNNEVYSNTMDLSSHVENMTQNINLVNQSIDSMGQIHTEGIDTIDNLDAHFQESMTAIEEVAVKISELQVKSNSINTIISAISEIAAQTNLLALNASIEAARAGEQGKGFAVVADEVRKLAESSTSETQEIASIIKDITDIIQVTVEKMTTTKESIAETNQSLHTTKEMFDRLHTAAQQINASSAGITDSISYVSDATDSLLSLTESISAISEEVAASSKSVSESSIQQSEELGTVNRQIIMMNEVTNELSQLLEKYQL